MKRFLLCIACFVVPFSGSGQTPGQPTSDTARPAFDVAAIRPSAPDSSQRSNVPLDADNVYGTVSPDDARSASAGLFIATHQALWRYISFAYKLSGTQELALRFNMFSGAPKSGAPLWVTGSFTGGSEFFDITARAPADTTIDQMRLMMQSLLAERFHLVIHYTTADAPVFAIILAKPGITGPNLKVHPTSDACPTTSNEKSSRPEAITPQTLSSRPEAEGRSGETRSLAATSPSPVGNLPPLCGVIAHVPSSEPGQHYGGRAVPLALLATSLPTMTSLAAMPRPVVDEAGLTGLYDFALTWVHDPTPDDSSISDNIANFRTALKNQLGVTLKPSHAPISFLIVDHVEKPSEN
jgi:uncharacterized protein (TIGR03435 family)